MSMSYVLHARWRTRVLSTSVFWGNAKTAVSHAEVGGISLNGARQ